MGWFNVRTLNLEFYITGLTPAIFQGEMRSMSPVQLRGEIGQFGKISLKKVLCCIKKTIVPKKQNGLLDNFRLQVPKIIKNKSWNHIMIVFLVAISRFTKLLKMPRQSCICINSRKTKRYVLLRAWHVKDILTN